jgi:hypothetical protein
VSPPACCSGGSSSSSGPGRTIGAVAACALCHVFLHAECLGPALAAAAAAAPEGTWHCPRCDYYAGRGQVQTILASRPARTHPPTAVLPRPCTLWR